MGREGVEKVLAHLQGNASAAMLLQAVMNVLVLVAVIQQHLLNALKV
jgi:hypothetical protein